MPPQREVSMPLAALFALLVVGALVAGMLELRVGVDRQSPLQVMFAALMFVLAAFGGYESFALATGWAPTISVVTDDAYQRHRLAWMAVFAVLLFFSGLLTEHFTWQAPRGFGWQALLLGGGLFLLGGVAAVFLRFMP